MQSSGCGKAESDALEDLYGKFEKEEFVTAAKKELQPYLTKKDEKQIDTTYDTTYTIDRRH